MQTRYLLIHLGSIHTEQLECNTLMHSKIHNLILWPVAQYIHSLSLPVPQFSICKTGILVSPASEGPESLNSLKIVRCSHSGLCERGERYYLSCTCPSSFLSFPVSLIYLNLDDQLIWAMYFCIALHVFIQHLTQQSS